MKRLALALALVTSAAMLSGCIIVPHRHGGYRDGYARDGHYPGRYDGGGTVYVQPGQR